MSAQWLLSAHFLYTSVGAERPLQRITADSRSSSVSGCVATSRRIYVWRVLILGGTWSDLTRIRRASIRLTGQRGTVWHWKHTCTGRTELMIDLSEGSGRNRSPISSSPITVQCDLAGRAALWSSRKADDASARCLISSLKERDSRLQEQTVGTQRPTCPPPPRALVHPAAPSSFCCNFSSLLWLVGPVIQSH